MILEIVSFREYRNYKINIPNTGITLLNGISGTGKTTILRAIRYCLYGGMAHGEKYEVKLIYKKIKITRWSKPTSHVEVVRIGEVFTDDSIAQQIIADEFGSADLFDLCCYMKQGDIPCPLLSSVSKDRLRYLSRFAFKDTKDPILIIEAIGEKLKEVKKDYQSDERDYEKEKGHLKAFESEILLEEADFALDVNVLQTKINKIQERLSQNEKSNMAKEKHLSTIEALEKQLEGYTNEEKELTQRITKLRSELAAKADQGVQTKDKGVISSEKENLTLDVHSIGEKIIHLEQQLQKRLLYDKQCQLKKMKEELILLLGSDGKIPQKFTDRDYYQLETKHKELTENEKVAAKLEIGYDKDIINTEINKLKRYKDYVNTKKQYAAYVELKTKYDDLLSNKTYSGQDSKTETIKLHDMKKSLDLLECPHCKGLLRMGKNNSLIADNCHGSHKVSAEEIKKQTELVKKLEKFENETREINTNIKFYEDKGLSNFQQQDDLDTITLSEKAIDKRISDLLKIKICTKPTFSLIEGRLMVTYFAMLADIGQKSSIPDKDELKQVVEYEEEISNLKTDIKKKNAMIQSLVKELKSMIDLDRNVADKIKAIQKNETLIANIEVQKEKIMTDIANKREKIDDTDYNAIKIKLEKLLISLQHKVRKADRVIQVTARREKLAELKTILKEKRNDLQSLMNLYDNAIKRHKEQLQNVIDSINICIANGVDKLFSYPLIIALQLYSPDEEDEKKRYKHKVEFSIIKKGKESKRSPEDVFSGGEMKRMILLIAIALNTLHKAPILLMDEMFASLDSELREDCLAMLKYYINDRIILCAEHYAERGDYDHCIDIMSTNAD